LRLSAARHRLTPGKWRPEAGRYRRCARTLFISEGAPQAHPGKWRLSAARLWRAALSLHLPANRTAVSRQEDLHMTLCLRGFEETISRILYPYHLATVRAAIIYLGRRLPGASSDQPEG